MRGEMLTKEDHINGLIKLRAYHQQEVDRISRAIVDLKGSDISETQSDAIPQIDQPRRKVYPKYKLEKLIQEGYNHKWANPEKIMWFLKTTGKRMYIRDMKQMTHDMMPELTSDQLDKIGLRLGYQAGQMAKKGIIEMTKEGVDGIYWLRDY